MKVHYDNPMHGTADEQFKTAKNQIGCLMGKMACIHLVVCVCVLCSVYICVWKNYNKNTLKKNPNKNIYNFVFIKALFLFLDM